jgi:hypothetical protein
MLASLEKFKREYLIRGFPKICINFSTKSEAYGDILPFNGSSEAI